MDAGNLEKLANELAYATIEEGTEPEREPGQSEWEDRFVGLVAGVEVTSIQQRLLMVLSNVGFCHATSLPEQTRKYEHVWTYQGSAPKPRTQFDVALCDACQLIFDTSQ